MLQRILGCVLLLLALMPLHVLAGTITLPATGQTGCYNTAGAEISCASSGQDGGLRTGTAWPSPRFTDNSVATPADLTITDNLTGLIWTKNGNPSSTKASWQGALDYIKNLNSSSYLGHNDWRLPNINEQESLFSLQQPSQAAWLNTQGFTNVKADYYWTSSRNVSFANTVWVVNLNAGNSSNSLKNPGGQLFFWPVRSGSAGTVSLPKTGQTDCNDDTGASRPCNGTGEDGELQSGAAWPSPRFSDNSSAAPADLTVTDNLTGLIWTKNTNPGGNKLWLEALDYIKELNNSAFLGHSDWRMPNRNELESLVNKQQPNQATWLGTQGFTNTTADYYWTSSSYLGDASTSWTVYMKYGDVSTIPMSTDHSIWPVRGGQGGMPVSKLSPAVKDFGSVTTGTTSVGQTFILSSAGQSSLMVSAIALSGGASAQYSLTTGNGSGGTCGSAPTLLEPGVSCTVSVTFSPTSIGSKTTTLRIASIDPLFPNNDVALSGTGVAPFTVSSSVSGGNGTISCVSPVNYGASSVCTISPVDGYHLETFSDNTADKLSSVSGNSYTIANVTANHTITGTFAINTSHTVTFTSGGNGSLSGATNQTVNYGASTTAVTALPASGYFFANWTGTNEFVATTDNPLTVTNVTATQTVTANFVRSITLPATGQTKCYDTTGAEISCASTGQDGALRTGISWPSPRFTDNSIATPADLTVTDNLTGLIWTKDGFSGELATWQGALNYIKTLNSSNFLGHNDWRLPNINELESLINQQQSSQVAWLSAQGFNNIQDFYYWSSSSHSGYTNAAWVLVSNLGYPGVFYKTHTFCIWPVRSGSPGVVALPRTGRTDCFDAVGASRLCSGSGEDGELQSGAAWPSPRFSDNSFTTPDDLTITDNLTGLVWRKNDNQAVGPISWQAALDYIKELNNSVFLGHSDWRMPNRNELKSIINIQQLNPNQWLNTQGFADIQPEYWSSDSNLVDTGVAWTRYLNFGNMAIKKSDANLVWPVRGGQGGIPVSALSPLVKDFGNVTITTTSASQTFNLSNGGQSSLVVSSITLNGGASDQFTLVTGTGSGGTCGATPTLVPGAGCTVSVTFSPTSSGLITTTLRISSNDPLIPNNDVGLSGTGVVTWPLNITITGNGSGSINSIPSGFTCTNGLCSRNFSNGFSVVLTPSVSDGSTFAGWSGDCSGTGDCTISMTTSHAATAAFSLIPRARINGTPYGTLSSAYAAVKNGETIESKTLSFVENLNILNGYRFAIKGGFADNYGSQTGYTILDGVLTIGSGGLTVDRLVIQ